MNNNDCRQLQRTLRRAFTLIELLIVIALTAVLLTLLIVPLISALRYTQQAQIVTAAQDAARITRERITRELSSAVFVFDGTSHPFQTANKIQPGDDAYTNFLDLEIPGINLANGNYKSTVAHAYNAKLDFVMPRASTGAVADPTTGQPGQPGSQDTVNYTQSSNGSAIISNPSLVFPLAAGTNAIRYFIGLKDPSKPYNNTREGKSNGSTDNTYVLYRAQFVPYTPVTNANGNATSVTPNTALFATRNNSSGVSIPELDDPDFFRYVTTNDINWLNDSHAVYTPAEVTAHNSRVDKWVQISKVVIPGPNVDLILLPHNADNTLAYDLANADGTLTPDPVKGKFPGVAHSGAAHDPVSGTPGTSYPIVNTSVTFRPATISGNATPGTTSDYNTQGAVSVDQSGYTYTPTVYTTGSQSWSLPFHVSLYPGNYDATNAALSMYYDTEQFAAIAATVTAPSTYTVSAPNPALMINPGDILEYLHQSTDTDATGTLVYNVTQGYPVTTASGGTYTLGGTTFVPMTINPDNGTLSFTAPSLPNGPYDHLTRAWQYGVLDTPANDPNSTIDKQNLGGIASDGTVDLTLPVHATPALTDSPLQGYHMLTASGKVTSTGVQNAHIVPGSIRVTGPDQTPGPNFGQMITYTEVNQSIAGSVGDNQFAVDYLHSTLQFTQGTSGQTGLAAYLTQNSSVPIGVIYDYQSNFTLTDPTRPFTFSGQTWPANATTTSTTDNPYLPMQVKVDYQTRDLIDVNIGVRIFDITNNRAQVIPTETKIKIGNSNR